jgi:hypothetical protein
MSQPKQQIILALADFLVANQAGKSILLQQESTRPSDDPRPRVMKEWAKLREVFGIHGWPSREEAIKDLTELLS